VCLSKSIGAFGLPLALTLIKPELDVWEPGEHHGTFRGVNPAFVAGTEAIRTYWRDDKLEKSTLAKGEQVGRTMTALAEEHPGTPMNPKGRGLARGLAFESGDLAGKVCRAAFERGLLMETSGPDDEVVKVMPSLTITDDELAQGLEILSDSVRAVSGA
jgi:diaminobutyrate-2-oxoglutarate transaminase